METEAWMILTVSVAVRLEYRRLRSTKPSQEHALRQRPPESTNEGPAKIRRPSATRELGSW